MAASLNPELTELSLEQLRLRRSAKWRFFDEDVLPAWVAEMDFPLAAPIKVTLAEAVELSDTGYGYPGPLGLAEAFADFSRERLGWEVDPAGVHAAPDVVNAITSLLRTIAEPGDRVVITEDTVTRGSSLLEAASVVRAAGAEPILLVAVVDRGGTVEAMAAAEGIPFRAVFSAPELGFPYESGA